MTAVSESWSYAIRGFILLIGSVTVVVLYRQAKASDGIERGKKWGYLIAAVIFFLVLASFGNFQ